MGNTQVKDCIVFLVIFYSFYIPSKWFEQWTIDPTKVLLPDAWQDFVSCNPMISTPKSLSNINGLLQGAS